MDKELFQRGPGGVPYRVVGQGMRPRVDAIPKDIQEWHDSEQLSNKPVMLHHMHELAKYIEKNIETQIQRNFNTARDTRRGLFTVVLGIVVLLVANLSISIATIVQVNTLTV